jgi:HK97 gp10 family phage protein
MPADVQIEGLKELRRAMRAMDAGIVKEVNAVLREAVQPIAADAASHAPYAEGKLRSSVRAGATAKGAFIRSRAEYAGVQEFGGTIRFTNRQRSIHIKPQPYMWPAAKRGTDGAVDRVGDALDRLTTAHGFR